VKLRIATWNINSIRIRLEHLRLLLEKYDIDIIKLQETKCQDKDFPLEQINSFGYNALYCGQKSYNGVAILSRMNLNFESKDLFSAIDKHPNDQARFLHSTLTINSQFLHLINVYIPNGQDPLTDNLDKSSRFEYKLNFYDKLFSYLETIKDEHILFSGDMNVAKDEIDLWNPEANREKVGFHFRERAFLKKIESNLTMLDSYRMFHPNKVCYSWWDYRTKAFDRDLGWRIDYIFASNSLKNHIAHADIIKECRGWEKFSDHTVAYVDIEL
jgi:exodeoxyribonuclease-3